MPATAGQQVTPGIDSVTLDGHAVEPMTAMTYLMMNKPTGVLTSVGDPRGRPTVVDRLTVDRRLFPVGRLDLESRGLLLLTDDGDLAMRLMHPRYGVEKEYRVIVEGRPSDTALRRIAEGMMINKERFQPAGVRIVEPTAAGTRLDMILREGHKREVRRIWQALGHRVIDLQRTRIDGVSLGNLPEGATRPLTPDEVESLKAAVS